MDPATLLQRLVRSGALTTAQARWVEQQADGDESVVDILARYGLVRTGDLEAGAATGDLVAVAAAQKRCDRMMQVIFELCVARGIIDHGEYLERLARAEAIDAARAPSGPGK